MLDDNLPSLTVGYLMLDDSLPSPYDRLLNVIWLPFVKIKSVWGGPWKIKNKIGIPSSENRKVTWNPFHDFDRYEIHVQAFANVVLWTFYHFHSSSSQIYIKIYTHFQETYWHFFKEYRHFFKFQNCLILFSVN